MTLLRHDLRIVVVFDGKDPLVKHGTKAERQRFVHYCFFCYCVPRLHFIVLILMSSNSLASEYGKKRSRKECVCTRLGR